MDVLHDPTELTGLSEVPLANVAITDEELTLAGLLINSATTPIRWSDYHDDTAERFAVLVEAKLQGRGVHAPPQEEIVALPLLEALKQSAAAVLGSRGLPSSNHRSRKTPPKSA
jgi:non-homologous end joining protein Ku